jgi:hypothetical protein
MAVATGTALAIGAGAGLVGSSMQARASRKAADTQAAAADRSMAQEREMYDISREDLAPHRELGYIALGDIERLMPMFTQQFGPEQLARYLDPSMDFRMRYGTKATERLGNVGGSAISGNTVRALTEFGQDLASTEYANAFNRAQTEPTNIFNRLSNIAGMGQGAVNTGVTAGQNFAESQTGLITGQAAAQAAGGVGAANAYSGALGNAGNMMYLNSLLGNRAPGTAVTDYGLSGNQISGVGGNASYMGASGGLQVSPNQVAGFFNPG